MNQSFLNSRFEQIDKRLGEIDTLLELAEINIDKPDRYRSLCRSANVLLVSHLEGLYKDLCKDIIDDINYNLKYHELKKDIFNSYCYYFTNTSEETKATHVIKERLKKTFSEYKCDLKVDPFLHIDNRNPTPTIIEDILNKFGLKNFFWLIDESDLDIAFKGGKFKTHKLRDKLKSYLLKSTSRFPYTVDFSIINPIEKRSPKPPKTKTFWEEFIDSLLRDRHLIVHGQMETPQDHNELYEAKIKIELLIYVIIIALAKSASPVFLLPEAG